MNKKVIVKLVDDAEEEYLKLNKLIKLEIKKGVKKSSNQQLLKAINQKKNY